MYSLKDLYFGCTVTIPKSIYAYSQIVPKQHFIVHYVNSAFSIGRVYKNFIKYKLIFSSVHFSDQFINVN